MTLGRNRSSIAIKRSSNKTSSPLASTQSNLGFLPIRMFYQKKPISKIEKKTGFVDVITN